MVDLLSALIGWISSHPDLWLLVFGTATASASGIYTNRSSSASGSVLQYGNTAFPSDADDRLPKTAAPSSPSSLVGHKPGIEESDQPIAGSTIASTVGLTAPRVDLARFLPVFQQAQTTTAAGPVTTVTSAALSCSGTNRLLLVFIGTVESPLPTGVTFGGTALTQVGFVNTLQEGFSVWALADPTTDPSTIQVTWAAAATGIILGALQYVLAATDTTPYLSVGANNGSCASFWNSSVNAPAAIGVLAVGAEYHHDLGSNATIAVASGSPPISRLEVEGTTLGIAGMGIADTPATSNPQFLMWDCTQATTTTGTWAMLGLSLVGQPTTTQAISGTTITSGSVVRVPTVLNTLVITTTPIANPVFDQYDFSNLTGGGGLGQADRRGQTIVGSRTAIVDRSQWRLSNNAGTTGTLLVRIYATTGTHGVNAVPTGTALATSDTFDVATGGLTGAPSTVTFVFSGLNRIQLTAGVTYALTIEFVASSGDAQIGVGQNTVAPAHAGNAVASLFPTSTWSADATRDLVFRLLVEDHVFAPTVAFPVDQAVTGVTIASGSIARAPSVAYSITVPYLNYLDVYEGSNDTRFPVHANNSGGQSVIGSGRVLDACAFRNSGASGDVSGRLLVARVYAATGTYGTSAVPTGAVLAESSPPIDAATLPPGTWTVFTFTGANRIVLTNGVTYMLMMAATVSGGSGDFGPDGDNTSPTHPGNAAQGSSAGWVAYAGIDVLFRAFNQSSVTFAPTVTTVTAVSSPTIASAAQTFTPTVALGVQTVVGATIVRTVADAYLPTSGTTNAYIGQSFFGNGQLLSAMRFRVVAPSGASGDMTALLFTATGTHGTDAKPAGSRPIALAVSDPVTIIPNTAAYQVFSFPQPMPLVAGTLYVAALHGVASNGEATVVVGGTHPGNASTFDGTNWTAQATWDVAFEVDTTPTFPPDVFDTTQFITTVPIGVDPATALPAPLAYWPFDEATGTTAADASGNGHTATLVGGTWDTTLERFGAAALANDGSDRAASFTSINLGTTHSIAFWMDGWDGVTDGIVIGGAASYYGCYIDSSSVYYSVGLSNYVSWVVAPPTGPHHIVITRNGSNVTLYIDGSYAGVEVLLTSTALTVGSLGGYDDGSFGFPATVDEVRVYSAELTSAQVAALYGLDPSVVYGAQLHAPVVTPVSGGGAQTVSGATIASGSGATPPSVAQGVAGAFRATTTTLFAPVIVPGAVTVLGTTRASTVALFAPNLTPGAVGVSGATLASTQQLFVPTVAPGAVTVLGATLGSTAQAFAPSVAVGPVTILGATRASTAVLFAPTLPLLVAGATLASTSALFVPVVAPGAVSVTGVFRASTVTLFVPTVVAGPATLTGTFIGSGALLYIPSVAPGPVGIVGVFRASTIALFAPSVAYTVVGATRGSTATLNAPAVAPGPVTVTGAVIGTTAVSFTPSVAVGGVVLTGAFIGSTTTLSVPVISTGPVVVSLPFRASASVLFAPVVAPGTVTITGPFRASTATLFAPSLTVGPTTASGTFIPSTLVLYTPTVVPGAIGITGATVLKTSVVRAPAAIYQITGAFRASAALLFAPRVAIFTGTPFLAYLDGLGAVFY